MLATVLEHEVRWARVFSPAEDLNACTVAIMARETERSDLVIFVATYAMLYCTAFPENNRGSQETTASATSRRVGVWDLPLYVHAITDARRRTYVHCTYM